MLHIEYVCDKCSWKRTGGHGVPLRRLDEEGDQHAKEHPGHSVHMRERHDSW